MENIIDLLNEKTACGLIASLGIRFTACGSDWLEAEMPIDERTVRPGGDLHGGANLALAETLGGALGLMIRRGENVNVFGMQVSGNHMKKAKGNYVKGRAKFLHKGGRTQVLEVEIRDEFDTLVSVCHVTNMVLPDKNSETN